MKVSILMATHNNELALRDVLKIIYLTLTLKNKFADYEILVLDNDADAKTKECLEYVKTIYPNFRVLTSEVNLNYSQANNLLAKEAVGEYLLFLHDDCFPQNDWLLQLLACADRTGAGIVGCKHGNPNVQTNHAGVGFTAQHEPVRVLYGTEENDPRINIEREVQAVCFACALVKKSVFDVVGGFVEYAPDAEWTYHFEDLEFCIKALQFGIKIIYTPKAIAIHYGAQTRVKKSKVLKADMAGFMQKYSALVKPDVDEFTKVPEGQPHILIGIPISESYDWIVDQLVNNIMSQTIWKGNVSIYWMINNSGPNFCEKMRSLAKNKLIPAGYKEVYFPKNIVFEQNKNKAIVAARNDIRETAKEINATHVFFWDCDVLMEPETIERLLKLNTVNVPISCGVVYYKDFVDKNKPMLFNLRENIDLQEFEKSLIFKKDIEINYMTADVMYHNAGLGPFAFFKQLDGKVHDVAAAGMGCVLINRQVLDDIIFESEKRGFGSEDLWWFFQAAKKGLKVQADTALRTYHLTRGQIHAFSSID